jgi:SAM-dependent methyltransferase
VLTAAARRQFVADYGRIRAAEGRGSDGPDYYRALPYADLTGRNAAQWAIRASSFDYFRKRVLPPQPCDILDLGAGNCWFSYRVAELGHRPVAIDIFSDSRDGLGAAVHYPVRFPIIESQFDELPFRGPMFDLAVFASSFHYSTDYLRTLAEVRRCLKPEGRIVIIDTPVYEKREHGDRMVAERHSFFERQYGFRSDAVPSIEFLDRETLRRLSRELDLEWRIHRPWYGWNWRMRPWKARLQRRRPPSQFWILVANFR